MKKINNRGYMLVEIILAFSIAFVLIYFVMDLIVKLKNKNEDLMVETLVRTDQTIITNKLMSYVIGEEKEFNCDSLKITDTSIKYNDDMIDIVSKYAKIDTSKVSCGVNLGKVSIKIPIKVDQMEDENFDVVIDYKYDIGDMIPPTCNIIVNGTTIEATYADNEDGSGIKYYGFDSNNTGKNESTKTINGVGIYTFYVVDNDGNKTECKVDVKSTEKNTTHEYYNASKSNKYTVGTTCLCQSEAEGALTGKCTSEDGTCSCPMGDGTTVYGTCVPTSYSYYCYKGGILSGTQCDIATTTYDCDTGYEKINNSYCYRLG